ncbi:metallophosphoesterase [Streptococcus sp. ZY19097]|uniref:metallophosphoesterase n=1 Tax=Streptococcus sp. ZY19097 TaxID=3231906 RepID=UPI00345ACFA0
MSKIYVMSDIHGHYDEFIESLSKVDLSDTDNRLILLGDYIDGGSQSFQVISKIIELEKKFPDQVITLLGNHEEYFSEWLFEEDGDSKYTSYDTIISFIGQNKRKNIVDTVVSDFSISDEECLVQINKKIRDCITSEYPEIVDWFRNKYFNSERFYETDNQIFVHAGIDEEFGENWKLYSNPDIFTSKFPASIGKFYKDIISGHIYSEEIAKDSDMLGKIYFDNYNHYYIDGHVFLSKTIPVLAFDMITKKYHFL